LSQNSQFRKMSQLRTYVDQWSAYGSLGLDHVVRKNNKMTRRNINTCSIDNGTSRSAYGRTRRRLPCGNRSYHFGQKMNKLNRAGKSRGKVGFYPASRTFELLYYYRKNHRIASSATTTATTVTPTTDHCNRDPAGEPPILASDVRSSHCQN
jgi:hypothetical protein